MINRNEALIEEPVLEESKLSLRPRPDRADGHTCCTGEAERLKAAAFEIDKRAANPTIRIVVPGSGIRRRSGEHAERGDLAHAAPQIAAVDGAQAAGPRNK